MTRKGVMYLGMSQGNEAMESVFEDEGVRLIMEGHIEVGKKFWELEFGAKIDKAAIARTKGLENMIIEKNDEVYHQTQNEKA